MSQLPSLDVHLYGFAAAKPAGHLDLPKQRLPIVAVEGLEESLFAVSFEALSAALQKLERLYWEPDGSFVWSGQTPTQRWQLDGMLYDHHDRVQRVEIKGQCPREAWLALLSTLGYPRQPLIAHWLAYRCFVEVDTLTQLWPA